MIARLRAVLDRKQVPIRIQAAVEGKVIAKDTRVAAVVLRWIRAQGAHRIAPYKATVLQGMCVSSSSPSWARRL
jgi:hypothetical protein